jgi:hypothetical protein
MVGTDAPFYPASLYVAVPSEKALRIALTETTIQGNQKSQQDVLNRFISLVAAIDKKQNI